MSGPRRKGRLEVTPQAVAAALGLPAGDHVRGAEWLYDREMLILWIEGTSDDLPLVEEGAYAPTIQLVIERTSHYEMSEV